MTRINTTLAPIRKPDSISFGELAIAAGLAGKPVAVCFSESTAAETCQMWRYFSRLTGPERVLHVHGQADVRRLTKTFCHWRLVVVHAPRLFNAVAWTVQMHGSAASALPTIFSRSIPSEVDEVPIPLLVLRNTPDELKLTLTNVGKKPIKLDTYDFVQSDVKLKISGSDADSVQLRTQSLRGWKEITYPIALARSLEHTEAALASGQRFLPPPKARVGERPRFNAEVARWRWRISTPRRQGAMTQRNSTYRRSQRGHLRA